MNIGSRPAVAGCARWLAAAAAGAVLAAAGCRVLVVMVLGFGLGAAVADDARADAVAAPIEVPRGKGLPLVVRTALRTIAVNSFDDNQGTFEATTELRLLWADARLAYPDEPGSRGYREYRNVAAAAATMWTPNVHHANRIGEPTLSERRLRVFPDGKVESLWRTTAVYKAAIDVARFPFDHQSLKVDLVLRGDTIDTVDLDFAKDDVEFSRSEAGMKIDGWALGVVDLRRQAQRGWDGESHAAVSVTLGVQRVAGGAAAAVFIPLFASLLIPFLAIWMNWPEDGGFAVNAFELANVVIGGLFAVIALGFTISSSYPVIAAGDNTVTRLLGLNYVALAVSLCIIVVFYRFGLVCRWLGSDVQDEAFRVLVWAFPLVFVCTGLAFVLLAAA